MDVGQTSAKRERLEQRGNKERNSGNDSRTIMICCSGGES
ncbi:hypothetical protein Goshw_015800, partial [Gossypium schwendimanii]|nr:hypothetical protein [Gossypium schwendimanii]